jgi:predicted Zn-dependent peptidase
MSEAELARVRAHYLVLLAELEARNSTLAAHLASLFARGHAANAHADLRAWLASVDAAEVRRVAATWLRDDRTQIAVLADAKRGSLELQDLGRIEWYRLDTKVTGDLELGGDREH